MYGSILVPLDGSEHARSALEVAHALHAPGEGPLYLLHVLDMQPAPDLTAGAAVGPTGIASSIGFSREEVQRMDKIAAEAIEQAERSAHGLIRQAKEAAGLAGIQTRDIVRVGRPADVIVEEAESLGTEAIVMGSRGLSKIASLLMGGVSYKVLHTAPCRVVLVH